MAVTENVKQLNKQRNMGKENKRNNPYLATELIILCILHFPVVDRICHDIVHTKSVTSDQLCLICLTSKFSNTILCPFHEQIFFPLIMLKCRNTRIKLWTSTFMVGSFNTFWNKPKFQSQALRATIRDQGQKYLSQEKSDKYSHYLEHLNKMQFILVFLILYPPKEG